MKTTIATIRFGQADWMGLCQPTLETWCRRHGYELKVYGNDYPDYPTVKFCTIDMLKDFLASKADRLIYVDADVYVNAMAPGFPEIEGLAMATDSMHAEHREHWANWHEEHYGEQPGDHAYHNAGIWSVDRKAAKQWLAEWEPPFIAEFQEQHFANSAAYRAKKAGMKFSRLDSIWNTWPRDLEPAWMYHAWGDEKVRDIEVLRDFGFLDLVPDGRQFCFNKEGFPAQDKYLVLQFVKDSGLGNRFFEFAAGLHLAKRLNLRMILNWMPTAKRDFGLGHFGIGVIPFREFPVVSQRLGQGNLHIVDKAATAIHESTERFPAVVHPFQSEECFVRAADDVRKIFHLEPLLLDVPEGKTPVAVQVRRGDYVKHPRLNVVTPGYFLNAMDHIRQRVKHPEFFVVSDDPAWCRSEFGHLADVRVMPPQDAIDGLRTMGVCEAHIISNSTYGWWGAWLAEKGPVIAPEKWANNMKFYGDWKPVPDRWHKVSVTRGIEKKPLVSPKPINVHFREYPKRFDQAIVIPWSHKADRWHALRYCLRSIHANFTDTKCPIVILGTARPMFLTFGKHRVIYEDCWTYQEALMQGVQIASEVCWMNDDIMLLQPTGWDDLRRPLNYGPLAEGLIEDFTKNPNPWRNGFRKAVESLKAGGKEILNFSCHVPYRYEREKAAEILRNYGELEHKIPFEMLYFNRHPLGAKLMAGERTMVAPFGDARYANFTDARLSQELKNAIASRFPDYAPWEGRIPFEP